MRIYLHVTNPPCHRIITICPTSSAGNCSNCYNKILREAHVKIAAKKTVWVAPRAHARDRRKDQANTAANHEEDAALLEQGGLGRRGGFMKATWLLSVRRGGDGECAMLVEASAGGWGGPNGYGGLGVHGEVRSAALKTLDEGVRGSTEQA